MTTLVQNHEELSSGTPVTTGNSAGAGSTAWDATTVGTGATLSADNSQGSAHGAVSCQVATGSTAASAFGEWNTTLLGAGAVQTWFRGYYKFTANPAANLRLWAAVNASTLCGGVLLQTTGKLVTTNTAGTILTTTASAVPLNAWCRVEGFLIASATVGQVEVRLFKTLDSGVPDEVNTSAATANTSTTITRSRFGLSAAIANAGPYWHDDLAASTDQYVGPVGGVVTLVSPNAARGLAVHTRRPWPAVLAQAWPGFPFGGQGLPVQPVTAGGGRAASVPGARGTAGHVQTAAARATGSAAGGGRLG